MYGVHEEGFKGPEKVRTLRATIHRFVFLFIQNVNMFYSLLLQCAFYSKLKI